MLIPQNTSASFPCLQCQPVADGVNTGFHCWAKLQIQTIPQAKRTSEKGKLSFLPSTFFTKLRFQDCLPFLPKKGWGQFIDLGIKTTCSSDSLLPNFSQAFPLFSYGKSLEVDVGSLLPLCNICLVLGKILSFWGLKLSSVSKDDIEMSCPVGVSPHSIGIASSDASRMMKCNHD